jgi:hypothetical protein
MGWLMDKAGRLAPAPRCPTFRPRLEALEDRRLLNASAVLDAAGNSFRLNVNATGTLTETYLGQTATLATGVLRAHAYRDADGSIGITVVYNLNNGTFAAFDYDHTGGHYLGNNVIDVDKAFDRAGHIQEDVTYSGPTGFVTVEYNSTGAHVVPQGGFYYLLIHPFQDAQGALGEDVSYVTLGPSGPSASLIEYDSAGAHYEGRDIIADRYYDPSGRGFAYDVTYRGDAAVEYTDTAATGLGSSGLFLSAGLPSVVYASKSGCYCDASLSDPTVGHDDSATLQALIDAAPAGRGMVIVIDGPMKLGNVKLRSGITIQGLGGSSYGGSFPASGLIQAPNTDCVFRNFDWASNYNNGNPVTDYSTIVDQDVSVRDLFINGNRGSGSVNNACGGNPDTRYVSGGDGYSNPSKLPISPLTFFGVRNLHVENVFVYDPDTAACLVGYADNYVIQGVRVVSPQVYSQRATPGAITVPLTLIPGAPQGGNIFCAVLLTGSVRNGVVEDVSGYYHGALVGVVTDGLVAGNPAYYPAWYPGPCTDLQVSGLRADVAAQFFVLWSGSDAAGGAFKSLIDRVTVSDMSGALFQGAFVLDGPAQNVGGHGSEVIRGINMSLQCGTYPGSIASIEGAHADTQIEDVTCHIDAATNVGAFVPSLVYVNTNPSPSQLLSFSNVTVSDAVTALDYDLVTLTQNGAGVGGIQDVALSGVTVYRANSPHGVVVHVTGKCQPATLTLSNVLADGVKNVVLLDGGGTPSDLTLAGVTHRNAGGNATVLVDGVTLPRLRASGSNTALLAATVNGGVILSKQTDGTEGA